MDTKIADAWLKAAADLGIKVVAPFKLSVANGEAHWFEAYVADFGGPKGTVVGNLDHSLNDIRKKHGYYASNLSSSYETYDRKLFIDTLDDWGWFGEKEKQPPWYTGKP
ncbi:MAG: hypothetical protein ACRD9L_12380, partial [Bryobacteraceae bacterium]